MQEKINNKYNAVIIGAGSIGALKPDKYDNPYSGNILTIAHAFYKHPNINLVGIVDTDYEKAGRAAKKWGCSPYKYTEELKGNDIDLIAVCVTTQGHFEVLQEVLKYTSPKLVMCEKPFCENTEQAEVILSLYKDQGIPIQIDYIRRFCHNYQVIKDDIDEGLLKIQHAKVTYTRGLVHEACHAIDLFNFWFGEFLSGKVLSLDGIIDRAKEDPTLPVYLKYEKCPHVFMCPIDGRLYGAFEIELYTDQGKFLFTKNGTIARHTPVIPEPTYGDYHSLGSSPLVMDTDLETSLMNMADNCVLHLNGTQGLISPASDSVKIHKIYQILGVNEK